MLEDKINYHSSCTSCSTHVVSLWFCLLLYNFLAATVPILKFIHRPSGIHLQQMDQPVLHSVLELQPVEDIINNWNGNVYYDFTKICCSPVNNSTSGLNLSSVVLCPDGATTCHRFPDQLNFPDLLQFNDHNQHEMSGGPRLYSPMSSYLLYLSRKIMIL